MKKAILVFSLLPIAFASCNNSNDEKPASTNQVKIKNDKNMQVTDQQKAGILQAIDLYIEAGNKGSSKTAKEAFDSIATVSWVENDKFKSSPVQALYDFFDKGALESSYELTSMTVAEDVATVRIESQFGTAKFADMFALVKDGDKWKIVSKVYHLK